MYTIMIEMKEIDGIATYKRLTPYKYMSNLYHPERNLRPQDITAIIYNLFFDILVKISK